MAGQFQTLGDVKQAATYRVDLEGIIDRHPTLNLNQEVNLSCRQLRLKLANNDVTAVMVSSAILTLPTTEAVAGGGYAEIPWPPDAISVHGIDANVGGDWNPIPQGDFTQRRVGQSSSFRGDYRFIDESSFRWIIRSLPVSSVSPGAIMLFPVPTGGRYVIWSLGPWVELTNDTTDIPFQEGWIEWVIWDVGIKALIRDTGPQQSPQMLFATAERDRIWAEIKPATQRIANDGPVQPLNRYGSRLGGYRLVP